MRFLHLLQLASASGYALRGAAPQPAASAPLRRARSLAMMPNSILEEAAEAAVLTDPRSSTTPAAAAECAHGGGDTGRSALILGWFFAKDRELEYVRRMYAKNGFDEVVIRPSKVGLISKPRGWYRTLRRQLQPGRRRAEPRSQSVDSQSLDSLDRHFDVVHCMSGGFLALYVLLRSKVGLRFSTLLCDSTPILPKPAAFTRFARAYLASIGLRLPLKLLPERLHQWLVEGRWWLSIFYIKMKHRLLTLLGRLQGVELNRWMSGPVDWGLSGDYDRVATHALGTIYEGAAQCAGSEIIFLYNKADPFIDPADVANAAELAREVGLAVREVETSTDHIKALFSSPRTVFSLLRRGGEGGEEAAAGDAAREGGGAAGGAAGAAAPPASALLATAQKAATTMTERIDSLVFHGLRLALV